MFFDKTKYFFQLFFSVRVDELMITQRKIKAGINGGNNLIISWFLIPF